MKLEEDDLVAIQNRVDLALANHKLQCPFSSSIVDKITHDKDHIWVGNKKQLSSADIYFIKKVSDKIIDRIAEIVKRDF